MRIQSVIINVLSNLFRRNPDNMKQIKMKLLLLFLGLAIVVFMGATNCTCSFAYNDYAANVISIKPADSTSTLTLENADISLYAYNSSDGSYASAAAYSTSALLDGSFTITSPEPGRYKLDGYKSGWTFVPVFIEIGINGTVTRDLYAYPSAELVDNSEYEAQYTIIARWEASDIDADLTLTYGAADYTGAPLVWDTGTTIAGTDGTDGRVKICPPITGFASTGTRAGIKHHGDADTDSEILSESISIYSSDWLVDTNTIMIYVSATNLDGDPLLSGNQFAPGPDDYTSPAAFIQVDVMRRYDSNVDGLLDTDAHYGTWYIPYNSYDSTLHLITATYSSAGTGSLEFASANSVDTIRSIITE